ncbi:MAG: hypothetical protein GX597_12240 [Anaerolineaceae bacterium]|nr:hypothetical protein [Anaerolineaceae bacterium]
MKKGTLVSIFVALLLVLLPLTAFASYTLSPRILAGQNQFAGVIKVTGNADGSLTLVYMLRAGWCMTDSAVHTGLSLDDFPQNSGGAIPGQFDYQYDFGGCVNSATVTIADPAGYKEHTYVAVHVNVYGPDGAQETGWTVNCGDLEAGQFPGSNWSAFFQVPVNAWY